ncbi:toxin glutamine deamidase domain-containing protein [Rhizomonospora bruguierae]|uniref:toxin glutamine deamidase domain-containing protein n=1 Tax=Rhizomonospora bruguierae TaxID=1581705 RepID=UPI001BCAC304|nr:toxin glutamine deamidase domain-containing protein [Micromonospora sp. NBRC 107566]
MNADAGTLADGAPHADALRRRLDEVRETRDRRRAEEPEPPATPPVVPEPPALPRPESERSVEDGGAEPAPPDENEERPTAPTPDPEPKTEPKPEPKSEQETETKGKAETKGRSESEAESTSPVEKGNESASTSQAPAVSTAEVTNEQGEKVDPELPDPNADEGRRAQLTARVSELDSVSQERRQEAVALEREWQKATEAEQTGLRAMRDAERAAEGRAEERKRHREDARQAAEQWADERIRAREEAEARAVEREVAAREAAARQAARELAREEEWAERNRLEAVQREIARRQADRDASQAQADREESRRQAEKERDQRAEREERERRAQEETEREQQRHREEERAGQAEADQQDAVRERQAPADAAREQRERRAAEAASRRTRARHAAEVAAHARRWQADADRRLGEEARQRWAEFTHAAERAEAERARADRDARAREDQRALAERRAVSQEAARVGAERREAAEAAAREQEWRQAEEREAADAEIRRAQRSRLADDVRQKREAFEKARKSADDARAEWERAAKELKEVEYALDATKKKNKDTARESIKDDKVKGSGETEEASTGKGKGKAGEDATYPWSVAEGALGEVSVARVPELSSKDRTAIVTALMDGLPPAVRTTREPDIEMGVIGAADGPDLGTVAEEQEIRAKVESTLNELLTTPDPKNIAKVHEHREEWAKALFDGKTFSAGGRLIWIRPVPYDPRPSTGTQTRGSREYVVSFGSTKVGHEESSSSRRGLAGGLEETYTLSTEFASRLIAGLPVLSIGGEQERGRSSDTRVIWGRKLFVDNSTPFNSGLLFQVYVNGVEWGRPSARPDGGLLDLAVPTHYAKSGARADPDAPAAPHPTGRPGRPVSQAREVLNAIDLTPVLTEWHKALVAAFPADLAAEVAGTVTRQLLNERTTRNRSQWLLSTGDMTDTVEVGGPVRKFSGYVTTEVSLQEIQLADVTEDVTVRDDLGVISSSGVGLSSKSSAGLAASVNIIGLTHERTEVGADHEDSSSKVTGGFNAGFGAESEREAGLEVGGKVLNHTVLTRKENQARYRAVFEFTLTTYANHKVATVTRRVVAEHGVPVSEAAQFERGVYGDVFTARFGAPGSGRPRATIASSPLVTDPLPATDPEAPLGQATDQPTGTDQAPLRAITEPAPETAPEAPPPTASDVIDRLPPKVDGAPQARQGYVPPDGPAAREPLAAAMRRGQGLGIAANKPGGEKVADLILAVLRQKSGQSDIGATARRGVLARVGRAAMEADPSRIQGGRKFTVAVGSKRYQILVTEHRMELLDSTTYPMVVNGRTLTGATTAGSRSTEASLSGRVGGGPSIPVKQQVEAARGTDPEHATGPGHQGRVYVPRARVEAEGSRGVEQKFKQEVKEYRRTETDGDVVDHRYRTVYEVAIRELPRFGEPGPRETWLIGVDPDEGATTQLAVPVEHVPRDPSGTERTITAAELARAGAVRIGDLKTVAWEPHGLPRHLPLDTDGTAGLYPSFRHIPELPATAAKLYQRLNGLSDDWFDEPMNWPDEIFDLGAGSELNGHFPDAVDEYGWELQLPDHDGYSQVIKVRERVVKSGLTYQYSSDRIGSAKGVELEQYRQSAVGHGSAVERELGVEVKGGAGGLYLNYDTSGEKAYERGRAGANLYVEGEMSVGDSTGKDLGAIDITRATYNDTVHVYRGAAVFEITATRTKDGASESSRPRYVEVQDAMDLLAADRAAEDLGLDRPPADLAAAAEPRVLIDEALLPAVGHPERMRANRVAQTLLSIVEDLQRGRRIATGEGVELLKRALVGRFGSRKLEPQFLALNGQGVSGWFPVPGPYGSVQYMWVRVTGRPAGAPSSDRPRERVSLTLRGETHDATSNTSSSGYGWAASFQYHGRGAWDSDGDTLGGLGHTDYRQSDSGVVGKQEESKDIFRSGPKKSHEFEYPMDFTIDVALASEMPQVVKLIIDTARTVLFGGARVAGVWGPELELAVVEFWYNHDLFSWRDERRTTGDVRLIVPQYLTRPASAPAGGWRVLDVIEEEPAPQPEAETAARKSTDEATPAPTPTPVPAVTAAGRPVPWWGDPGDDRPVLNTDLATDRSLHPWDLERVAREFVRWAPLTTLPARLSRSRDLTADGAWRVPGVNEGSVLHRLVSYHAAQVMLRARLSALLRHRYEIPDTGITLGLDIRRRKVYVDGAGTPLGFEQKARRYEQHEQGPINESSFSAVWNNGFGPQGGRPAGIKKLGWNGEGGSVGGKRGTAHSAEMSEVNERNLEGRPTHFQYLYDVTAVIKGPHGTLLIDVDSGVYLMRDADPNAPLPKAPPAPLPPPPAIEDVRSGQESAKQDKTKAMPGSWPEDEEGEQAAPHTGEGQNPPEWTVGPDGEHHWTGEGWPSTIPPGLRQGAASGERNHCLLDSLRQLINARRNGSALSGSTLSGSALSTEGLRDFLLENLRQEGSRDALTAVADLAEDRMLDVYAPVFSDVLRNGFGVRIQVFEATGSPRHIVPHPILGTEGPLLHLHHEGLHFTPLWPTGDQTGRSTENRAGASGGDQAGLVDPSWPPLSGRRSGPGFERAYGWLRRVNPFRFRGGEFDTNCLLTAIAADLTQAARFTGEADGDVFQAPPSAMQTVADLANYTGRPHSEVPDYAAVEEAMRAAPIGARAIVVVTDAGGTVSHAFNAFRDREGVAYVDGQTGTWATAPRYPARIRFMAVTDGIPAPRTVPLLAPRQPGASDRTDFLAGPRPGRAAVPPGPSGSTEVLSRSDAEYFYELARSLGWRSAGDRFERVRHRMERWLGGRTQADKAREFVSYVVTAHRAEESVQRGLDQLVLAGHGLHRATVGGQRVAVRARVDDAGRVVSAHRATRLDQDLVEHGGDELLTELFGDGGWTARASHANTVDPDARQIALDFHSPTAWPTLVAAHAIATGPEAPPHLALEYRTFRGAQIGPELRSWARQLQVRLTSDDELDVRSALAIIARRTAREARIPPLRGPDPVDQPEEDSGCAGRFQLKTWKATADTQQPVDSVVRTLGHEMFHSEQVALVAQWRVSEGGGWEVLADATDDRDVWAALWEAGRQRPDDERYPAAAHLWRYHFGRTDTIRVGSVHQRVQQLATRVERRLRAAGTVDPDGRLHRRLTRGWAPAHMLAADADAMYASELAEAQAFMYVLDVAAGGSVLDWTRLPDGLVPNQIDGYDVSALGTAGSFVRPAGSTMEAPHRSAHPERPLVVVAATGAADAHRVLRELRDELPEGVLVELALPERVSAERAVALAAVLGDDRVLAIAADRLRPSGALVDNFVAYSWGHAPTLRPAAQYFTVHAEPQHVPVRGTRTVLDPMGGERYEMLPGWQVRLIGDRVWIGPAGAEPSIEDDDPPVVVGLPDRDTPWTVWQHALWLGRDLASHQGTTTDTGFVRVHRPDPVPPALPVPDPDIVHAVEEWDERLLERAFGDGHPVDPAAFAYEPDKDEGIAGPARQRPSFTAYDLLDELLDVAGADPAERDQDRLVAALDDLAGRLGVPRRELLPIAYQTARAFGVGALTETRLETANRSRHLWIWTVEVPSL